MVLWHNFGKGYTVLLLFFFRILTLSKAGWLPTLLVRVLGCWEARGDVHFVSMFGLTCDGTVRLWG